MSPPRAKSTAIPTRAATWLAPARRRIVALPDGGGHWTRDLAVAADGSAVFASVGSHSNDADEMRPLAGLEAFRKTHALGAAWGPRLGRADVLAFKPDGSAMQGIRDGTAQLLGSRRAAANLGALVRGQRAR